jgi:redox-sensing transcriptional repressor
MQDIPGPAIYRISFYLRQLETLQRASHETVSSKELGKALGYSDAQVRKDLTYFGQFGHPGVGYRVEELIQRLKKILGTDRVWPVVLIGAGNLGRALMSYKGFLRKGFQLAAVFDADPAKVGRRFGELEILPMEKLQACVHELQVRMAIIAVTPEAAQSVVDLLAAAGVHGVLNFSPTNLKTPPDVYVQSVDLALQLEQLSFRMSMGAGPPLAP